MECTPQYTLTLWVHLNLLCIVVLTKMTTCIKWDMTMIQGGGACDNKTLHHILEDCTLQCTQFSSSELMILDPLVIDWLCDLALQI